MNKELVKVAYCLGYRCGLEKRAGGAGALAVKALGWLGNKAPSLVSGVGRVGKAFAPVGKAVAPAVKYPAKWMGAAGRGTANWARRYMQLLRGGDRAIVGKSNQFLQQLKQMAIANGAAATDSGVKGMKGYWAAGSQPRDVADLVRKLRSGKIKLPSGNGWHGMSPTPGGAPVASVGNGIGGTTVSFSNGTNLGGLVSADIGELEKLIPEIRKVRAARLAATGVAGAGAVGAGALAHHEAHKDDAYYV